LPRIRPCLFHIPSRVDDQHHFVSVRLHDAHVGDDFDKKSPNPS
jgi:hypothetical protein